MAEDAVAHPLRDKAARRAERARVNRLSRLPMLYDYALTGRNQALLAGLAQVLVVLAVTLLPAKAVTGSWLPSYIGILVLAVGFALQAANRYLNARAGRR
ncbi:MAG: hypothetical protein H7323_15235 [Frankiales bacterium]|nr:hypothetical protein [Frankiales bacterium]